MFITERGRNILQSQQSILANWINRNLYIDTITAENFMEALDNGVIICKLAKLIQQKAERCRQEGFTSELVPDMSFKCWENARPESFFARENTENFLKWCRKFGVREAVMFESEGLVLHTQPRTVVLCLLELGRIATKYGIEPPGLVKLEKEIDEQESTVPSDPESISPPPSLIPVYSTRMDYMSITPSPIPFQSTEESSSTPSSTPICTETDSVNSVDSVVRQNSSTALSSLSSGRSSETRRTSRPKSSELDKKVMQIAEDVLEDNTLVKRISEGRYNVAGKTVFVRLLKGRHVMVRVGGGWDTLEHFLSRHNVTDPCQVKLIDSKQAWSDFYSQTPMPVSNEARTESFLNVKANYRSSRSSLPDISIRSNYRKMSLGT
ncbi:growth arrest-specific protein 2-like isoform X2 [Tachypleus tridentatus]|uniref:growth arrest-specific protein 2-like isoform X2 n=1 Tax=Tachypleus tridentatus TaxID=6853 RepID=UPI003FD11581